MLKKRTYDMQFRQEEIFLQDNRKIRRMHQFRNCSVEIDGKTLISNDVVISKHRGSSKSRRKRKKKA